MNCLPDCHTHSLYSPDAKASVAEMAQAAQRCGLTHLALTDHCDCEQPDKDRILQALLAARADVLALRAQTPVRLLCGVELGQPTQAPQMAQRALSAAPWDVVIGSLHSLAGEEDFYWMQNLPAQQAMSLLKRYFDEQRDMVRWGQFDTLAHLTYPLRYLDAGMPETDLLKRLSQPLRALLCELAARDKALELNTGSWRQRASMAEADTLVLELFRQAGGRRVTLGSDAHRPQDVGNGIAQAAALLKDLGFSGVTVYEGRVPVTYSF